MNTELIKNITDVFTNNLTDSVPTIVFSIVVLIVGILLSRFTKKASLKFLNKLNIDDVISGYISYAIFVTCIFVTLMIVLSMIGVPVSTIMSLVAIVILGICITFKSSLENIGSGILILIFKPFKSGDYIETLEVAGIVSDMHLFNTTLKTFDNKTTIVPNSKLTNQSITNYTKQDKRRVDISFNLPYKTNIENATNILNKVLESEKAILNEPESLVGIRQFNESSMEIVVRAWVKTDDYWDAFYSLTSKIEKQFRENNIDMTIPQKIIYDK